MKHPFRHMRLTLRLTMAQCALLLATEGVEWNQMEYARFFMMSEMWHQTDNPTYPQMVGILGAFLRLYRALINRLPEGVVKVQCEVEWGKLTENYQDLLEVKTD